MEKTDVLVIGGSAAGIVTALTGKSRYPEKEFTVIRREKQIVVPCGIPYIFGSLGSTERNCISDSVLLTAGVGLKIGEVAHIDREKKICKTEDQTDICFDKLVLALGSTPFIPKDLEGTNLSNVFTVRKNKQYLDEMLQRFRDSEEIVIIGGGFIGVEMSDELRKTGKNVTIVEILPHILGLAFDQDIARIAEQALRSRGIEIRTGACVKEIVGDKKVASVILSNGEKVQAHAVILSVGYRPDTGLAERSGIELNELGFIKVDEYMRTSVPDIFAVGDCAEKRDFFTRKPSNVMLASTACAEARIAGMNLYGLSAVKTFSGTITIFSTVIGETSFGAAGLSENLALSEGFDVAAGTFEGVDKHPGTLDETHRQVVKLIFARDSGVMLGGEVVAGPSGGELINLIGLAIQNRMTINSILTSQVGTHPLLTAAPTAYPLIKAAEAAEREIRRR